eukprot:575082-Amphidinium_carterae.1
MSSERVELDMVGGWSNAMQWGSIAHLSQCVEQRKGADGRPQLPDIDRVTFYFPVTTTAKSAKHIQERSGFGAESLDTTTQMDDFDSMETPACYNLSHVSAMVAESLDEEAIRDQQARSDQ